ncbi:hypothetical protein [Natrinema salifodinae]|uniref:Uncharacterized protein n=1 Tax=Natrinema salifodinae TaxID=1202768 RepID=A0A1I0P924_9EURY|nr:hypothetical protein [Natrinema salifodinae]SEW10046.1 hypothetical protein SAMN05216285_2217 [Natrinema salifodinae]
MTVVDLSEDELEANLDETVAALQATDDSEKREKLSDLATNLFERLRNRWCEHPEDRRRRQEIARQERRARRRNYSRMVVGGLGR